MDRADVVARMFEEERRVALGWAGASGESDPPGAIRQLLHRERSVRHASIKAEIVLADAELYDLFVAFCYRYGLEPYRAPGQRKSRLMLDGPERFINEVFVPLFNTCGRIVRRERHAWFGGVISEITAGAAKPACGTCGGAITRHGTRKAAEAPKAAGHRA